MWFASKTTNSNLLFSTDDGEDGYKELVVVIGYHLFPTNYSSKGSIKYSLFIVPDIDKIK
jgi:hypothetical protein